MSRTLHSTPHLKWPNESCVIGTARKRTSFDELTLGQFVIGLVTNALETQHTPTMRSMLNELVETVKLAENISWPIASGAFAASMLKIEEESISWGDTRTLADHRLTYSQSAVFSGSTTMSPRTAPSTPSNGSMKKIACKWYNEGTCPHSGDHLDTTGTTLFRHICLYCFKTLKRKNVHVEADCLNKRKANTDWEMADCNFAFLPHVCEQSNQCSDKFVSTYKSGVGSFVEGSSPCVVSVECLRRLSVNFVNFNSMHNQGPYGNLKVKGQSWGFMSRSTARVILGQVLRIATCGTLTHRGMVILKIDM